MSPEAIAMRVKALTDYLQGWSNVGKVQYAFKDFPKQTADEETVDAAIFKAAEDFRYGGYRKDFEQTLRDTRDYLINLPTVLQP